MVCTVTGEKDNSRAPDSSTNPRDRSGGLLILSYALSDFKKNIVGRAPGEFSFRCSFRIYQRSLLSMDQHKSFTAQPTFTITTECTHTFGRSLRADQLRAYGGTRDVMPAVE